MTRLLASFLLLLAVTPAARCEPLSYYLPAAGYNREIPSPQTFLGFEIGQRHLEHHRIVAYLQALAEASPRVRLETIGQSHGSRPLVLLTISSPDNLKRLDEIRVDRRALTDPRSPRPDMDGMPAVVGMFYGVHGDEPSGSHAAVLVAYHLAAAEDLQTERFLNDLVILLDPCLNPDGFDRYAQWVNALRGRRVNASPDHAEHRQPWPGGRVNYYWFDLNRDWMPLTHPESQARVALYHRWKPNLILDFHEMESSSTYFFQPGTPSRANPLISAENLDLTQRIGRYHADALDALGSLYFTEEMFDDFYVGKGSTYPDLHGAVGILFEQAGSRGHAQRTPQGLRTLGFTIRNQVATSFSSLRAASDMRFDLVDYQRRAYDEAWAEAGQSDIVQHVFSTSNDPGRLAALVQLLRRHAIQCWWLSEDHQVGDRRFTAGKAVVAPHRQAEFRFFQALLQEDTQFADDVFYDISAWSIPLAYDLDHDRIREAIPRTKLQRQAPPSQPFQPDQNDVAYVLDWAHQQAPRFAFRLLEAGIDVRAAQTPFAVLDHDQRWDFARGSLVIPLGTQPRARSRVNAILRRAARAGLSVKALSSGLTDEGPDLGSSEMTRLELPRVAVAIGSQVRREEAGESWHLLDARLGMPTTLVDASSFSTMRLHDINVLVLPSGSYEDVDVPTMQKIGDWISEGGTLIAIGHACSWVEEAELANVRWKTNPPRPESPRPYAESNNDRAKQRIAGAILNTTVDHTHPLCFGVEGDLPVFRNHELCLEASTSPYGDPVRYASQPLLAGYCPPAAARFLADQPSVQVHARGQGRTILFMDNPNFRGYWLGSGRLFVNAVFLGPLLR